MKLPTAFCDGCKEPFVSIFDPRGDEHRCPKDGSKSPNVGKDPVVLFNEWREARLDEDGA